MLYTIDNKTALWIEITIDNKKSDINVKKV